MSSWQVLQVSVPTYCDASVTRAYFFPCSCPAFALSRPSAAAHAAPHIKLTLISTRRSPCNRTLAKPIGGLSLTSVRYDVSHQSFAQFSELLFHSSVTLVTGRRSPVTSGMRLRSEVSCFGCSDVGFSPAKVRDTSAPSFSTQRGNREGF